MLVKTDTEKPVLTYSKSRGLVALVTGTDDFWIFWYLCQFLMTWMDTCLFIFSSLFSFLLICLVAFMKQRRMGLNDFIQRLATNSYACKQWVPSDSCYCSALTGGQSIGNSTRNVSYLSSGKKKQKKNLWLHMTQRFLWCIVLKKRQKSCRYFWWMLLELVIVDI